MTVAEQREAVWQEALTWQGTPWAHQGRVKRAGVDCCQFPLAVYSGTGLIEAFDTGNYPRDWHIHMREERIVPMVEQFAREIENEAAQRGDLHVFKIGNVYSHCAIIGEPGRLGIHASIRAQMVTLCDLDRDYDLISSKRRTFTLKGW